MILGTGAKERDSLVQRLEKPLLARGALTSAVIAMPMAFRRCWAIVLMFLCLFCVNSWAVCTTQNLNCNSSSYRCGDVVWCKGKDRPQYELGVYDGVFGIINVCSDRLAYSCRALTNTSYVEYDASTCSGSNFLRYRLITCSTESEIDSIRCERDPSGPNCQNPCTEFQNDCQSRGGVWEGSVTSDTTCASTCDLCGTPESQALREYIYNSCCEGGLTPQYSCAFPGLPSSISGMVYSEVLSMGCNTANWETNKICDAFYEESSSSQNSSSSAAQSSSSVSEYCLLFPTDLACICAADSTHPDCQYLNSSASPGSSGSGEGSSGSGEGSSGSGGGGTPSSSGSGGVLGDDWEYDYRDSLHRIINATTRTATNTQAIKENTNGIWNLLKQAKCLFTDCTEWPDSNINIPGGDTTGVLDSMGRIGGGLDSMIGVIGGYDWEGYGDSLNGALEGMGGKADGIFSDSGLYGPMSDYRDVLEDNFPTSQWAYTSACPAALNSNISFTFPAPIGTISSGKNLGGYFCSSLPSFNITLGNMIRAVIRLAITIAMAIGIFKAATGFNNE